MALGALYPHCKTRGTSGVSLFLLSPQGASVYHAPKYEPIFSIILSLQRKPSTSSDKCLKNIMLLCIMLSFLKINHQSGKPLDNLILPSGVKTREKHVLVSWNTYRLWDHTHVLCLPATWMTWRGSVSWTTSRLSRMCYVHVWRPLASWKLTSPSKISTSS